MLLLVIALILPCAFAQNQTIVDALVASRYETILVDLVKEAALADILGSGGPFTVFAPDDTAFNRIGQTALAGLKNDTNLLGEVLKYHVVSGVYTSDDLKVNEKMLESLAGTQIRVNYYMSMGRICVEGSRITYKDKMVSNGIIHRVHDVMYPPVGSIVDVLSADSDFSTLVKFATAAGVMDTLSGGPLTVMAPTNAAFSALGNDTMTKLLNNPTLLAAILKYHVLHGTLYSCGMHTSSLQTLEAVDREHLYASFLGYTISVDSARVLKPDLSATNGVVHKISRVLIPTSLRSQILAL